MTLLTAASSALKVSHGRGLLVVCTVPVVYIPVTRPANLCIVFTACVDLLSAGCNRACRAILNVLNVSSLLTYRDREGGHERHVCPRQ